MYVWVGGEGGRSEDEDAILLLQVGFVISFLAVNVGLIRALLPVCSLPACCCLQEEFFIKFAEFEEMVKEVERARAIFKYGLDHLPQGAAQALYSRFVAFEKQHGDRWVQGGAPPHPCFCI
jgi:hypothetical protein